MDAKVLSFSSFASFFMDSFLEEKIEFLNRERANILGDYELKAIIEKQKIDEIVEL